MDDSFATSSTNLVLDPPETWNPEAFDFSVKLTKNAGLGLNLQQFYALFLKRVLHTLRNKLITITQLVVPLSFTILGLVAVKTMPSFIDTPSLALTADQYGSNVVPVSHGCPQASGIAQVYANQFKTYPSVRTVDVNELPRFKHNPNMVRYLVEQAEKGLGDYNLKYMFAGEFICNNNSLANAVMYFNNQAYHTSAIAIAAVANTLLQYITNSTDYSIQAYNDPLPRLPVNEINDQMNFMKQPDGFIISLMLTFGMAFLASSFLLFLVKERTVGAKHIQFVSGVHPLNFWLSTLCWDLLNFMVPCLLMVVVFAIFSIDEYIQDGHWLHMLVFFFLYGWAMLPCMYLFSFVFQVPSTAYVWITMFNIVTGLATLLVVSILNIPKIDLQNEAKTLEWIFLVLLPNFSLSQGLFEYYKNHQFIEACTKTKPSHGPDDCCFGNNDSCKLCAVSWL